MCINGDCIPHKGSSAVLSQVQKWNAAHTYTGPSLLCQNAQICQDLCHGNNQFNNGFLTKVKSSCIQFALTNTEKKYLAGNDWYVLLCRSSQFKKYNKHLQNSVNWI